jgi:hypothetical protein
VIDKKVANEQIERLSGLDWYPRKDDFPAFKELSLALQSAESEFIAAHVINEWLASEVQCPKPAELRRLVNSENEKREAERTKNLKNCKLCGGTRMIIVQVGPYTGAKDCECQLQRLSA